jgi:hypothetical protein
MNTYIKAYYSCPECTRKIERQIEYIDEALFKDIPVQTHAFWCIRCDARQVVELSLTKKNDQFHLSTIKLISNDKKQNKKLKISR